MFTLNWLGRQGCHIGRHFGTQLKCCMLYFLLNFESDLQNHSIKFIFGFFKSTYIIDIFSGNPGFPYEK